MQNHIYITAMMTIRGGSDLIVLIDLTGMMLMQQNSILEMTQISKESFTQWKIFGENQTDIPKSKSAHLLMSKMSVRNSLIRLKRSDVKGIIRTFGREKQSKPIIRKGF